jgi:hypothetical protein
MTGVIAVAVALLASVVTLIDSIDETVMTMYGYQRHLAVISPRNQLEVDPSVVAAVRALPMERRIYPVRPVFSVVKTVFGKMPIVIFGLPPEGRDRVMAACHLRLAEGRFPEEGKPEVALSATVARNRGLRLGGIVLQPNSEDSFSAVPVRLVGTFEGPVWFQLTSETFVRRNFPVSPLSYIVMAPSPDAQRRLDAALDRVVDKERARIWTYGQLVRETRDALSSLYLIMNIVVTIVVLAIAVLIGMLATIYFTQRLPEFATLAAIGYERGYLMLRALGEIALLCGLGWALGALLSVGLLAGIEVWLMDPRGLLLNPFDWPAYRYSAPLPLAIVALSLLTIGGRLRRMDPVSIIERRQ